MPTSKTWNNTSYSIPNAGELNWSSLTSFLTALADNAQTVNFQKFAVRVATSSPVTVSAANDCIVVTNLTVAGAVAVNLPAGVTKQLFFIVDGKGDAATNNITITPAAGTINGAATYVINVNNGGVALVYNGTEWTVFGEYSKATSGSGNIPRSKIAAGSANHVVINDGSGFLSSEAQLSGTRGGTGVSNSGQLTWGSNNLTFTLSGATSLTLPTAGTLATLAGAEAFTNKTINGSSNTITNVSLTTAVTGVLPTANGGTGQNSTASFPTSGTVAVVPSSGVVKSNGSVLSSSNVSLTTEVTGVLPTANGGTGQNGSATFPTSGTVTTNDATATLQNKTLDNTNTVTVKDTLFTVQDDGDATKQAKFQASGITTGTTRTFTLPDANTTLVGTDAAQVITAKDIDGGTASNTSRITLPKDTTSNLSALTRKQGTIVYDTSVNKPYYDDGSTLKAIGSGSGSGGRNYAADFADGSTVGTVGSGNVTDTGNRSTGTMAAWQSTNTANISISSSSSTPLRETTSYLTTGSGNAAAGTTFIESIAWNLDNVDLGKPMLVQFDVGGSTTSTDWDVCVVRYNSSGTYQEKISVAGTASTATPASALIPTGTTTFRGFFIPSNTQTDYYALRFRRLAGTVNIKLDTITVGPQSIITGAAMTDWQSFTPTWGNFSGSLNASSFAMWRRVGDSMEIQFDARISSFTSMGALNLTIPGGYTFNSTYKGDGTATDFGHVTYYDDSANILYNGKITSNSSTFTQLDLYAVTGTAGNAVSSTFPFTWANADRWSGFCRIPISQWSSNVTLADRAVEEYASNSSTTVTTDTTSFAYGATGSPIPQGAAAGGFEKTVRFNSVIQPTDALILEIQPGGSGQWITLSAENNAADICNLTRQGSLFFGIGVSNTSGQNAVILFGRYPVSNNTSYGSGTGAAEWNGINSATRWRVRKVSGGASVGYPVSSQNIIGRTDGVAQAAGYIGEVVTGSTTTGSLTTGTAKNAANITLQPGVWQIVASIYYSLGASTTCSGSRSSISTTTNTTDLANMNCGVNTSAGNDFANIITRLVNISSATTYYAVANLTFATSTADIGSNSYIKAIRIA